jgi:hypothetical protein
MGDWDQLPSGAVLDSMSAAHSWLSLAEDREYGYRTGHVGTRHGIVGLYDQGRKSGVDQITRLDVVAGGKLYIATWERTFTDRFLITLASRFAAAAMEGR